MSQQYRNGTGQLSLAQAVSSAKAFQAEAEPSRTGGANPNSFKAPAHKHAHHLHSIPPREKSTRTLIIDHMLWVHGRTRFAQARAELGMTDRTGGPTSSHYAHRKRPENYEEEDEVGSDGEEVTALKARGEPDDDEEARLHAQDLQLARSLRLRAEGLEKVINSMLVQPPPVHLHYEDDLFVDPNQHTLPNGVRLRLALGTLVNDFFTRQAPPPPFRHKKYAAASVAANSPMTTDSSSAVSAALLPPSLNLLVPISAYGQRKAEKRAFKQSRKEQTRTHPPHSIFHSQHPPSSVLSKLSSRTRTMYLEGTDPETANSPPAFRCPRHLHTGCEICVEAKEDFSVKVAGGKGKARERAGSTATTPSTTNAPTPGSTFAASSWPSTSPAGQSLGTSQKVTPIGIAADGGGISGYQDPSVAGGCSVGVGEGLLKPSINGSVLRRRTAAPYTQRSQRGGGETEADSTGSGYTKLSELLPRLLRLSALVSIELGREVKEGREGKDSDEWRSSSGGSTTTTTKQGVGGGRSSFESYPYSLAPSREWYHLLAGILTRAALQGYLTAGWRGVHAVECLMGVGLGIDLQHRTKHTAAANPSQVPGTPSTFTEGNGDDVNIEREASPASSVDEPDGEGETDILAEDEDLFKEFNPDDLPSLQQAVVILFPYLSVRRDVLDESNGQGTSMRRQPNPAEAEFASEMNERLRKFIDIPESTPDLSTHMEDLAWQYPAEPVERAATRFLEAIAAWRGKPELEGYKKKPPRTWPSMVSPNGKMATPGFPASTQITLESIVHSNPSSPTLTSPQALPQPTSTKKPSIDSYFIHPDNPSETSSSVSGNGGMATHGNLNMNFPNFSTPSTTQAQTLPLNYPRGMGLQRQSFSTATSTPDSTTVLTPTYPTSHSRSPSQSNSSPFSQSTSNFVSASPPFQGRSSQGHSPRSSNSVLGSVHGHPNHIPHVSPVSSVQVQSPTQTQTQAHYSFYTNNPSSASSILQQRPMSMQSNNPAGQQIPVWNAATGAWVAPSASHGQGLNYNPEMMDGTTGSKRTRSPEHAQGVGTGPNAKRVR